VIFERNNAIGGYIDEIFPYMKENCYEIFNIIQA